MICLILTLSKECADHHCIELPIIDNCQNYVAKCEQSATQTTNISHPVKTAVNLAINDYHVQIHLERQSNADIIVIIMRPLAEFFDSEDVFDVFHRHVAPLKYFVLQVQFCQCNF